jgi:hypothetical protein
MVIKKKPSRSLKGFFNRYLVIFPIPCLAALTIVVTGLEQEHSWHLRGLELDQAVTAAAATLLAASN